MASLGISLAIRQPGLDTVLQAIAVFLVVFLFLATLLGGPDDDVLVQRKARIQNEILVAKAEDYQNRVKTAQHKVRVEKAARKAEEAAELAMKTREVSSQSP